MKLTSNPVVLPASEVTDMIQAIRPLLEEVSKNKSPSFLSIKGNPTG
ncbi:hypothetical protein [Marinomonas posidonica]|nr:hypothetical protein [Marinomonas posidonica]